MENLLAPDFVLTVGGKDVTKLCKKWELHDIDDAISSCTVTLINPEMKLSGQFNTGQSLSINWGYQNNMPCEVEMEIQDYSENYDKKSRLIIIKGKDCVQRMVGSAYRGNFGEGDTKKPLKDIPKDHNIEVDFGKFTPSIVPKKYTFPGFNEGALQLFRRYLYTNNPSPGGTSSANLPVGKNKGPNGSSGFKGQATAGNLYSGRQNSGEQEKEDKENTPCCGGLNNTTNQASSVNIKGHMDIIGRTEIRAKKMITILNVGPQASGDWYVKSANHTWDSREGYRTRVDLIRSETGKGGKGKKAGQPMVAHADIYKKNTMYCGPRKYGEESCGTYSFGTDDQLIESFKMTISVPEASGAGEKGQIEGILPDRSQEEKPGNPVSTTGSQ